MDKSVEMAKVEVFILLPTHANIGQIHTIIILNI